MNRSYITVLSAARNGRELIVNSSEKHVTIIIQDSRVDDRAAILINKEDWDFFLDRLNQLVGKFNQ